MLVVDRVRAYVRARSCGFLWRSKSLCVCVCVWRQASNVCLCFWSVFARASNYKRATCLSVCTACLLSIRESLRFSIWNMFVYRAAEEKESLSGSMCFFLKSFWLSFTFLTFFFFSPLCRHFSSLLLLLLSRLCVPLLSRWQAVLGHRDRLSGDRCGHLS